MKQSLVRLIELLEEVDSFDKIPNLKKLRVHKNAYRVRLGYYRLGYFFESTTITLSRFLHRKRYLQTLHLTSCNAGITQRFAFVIVQGIHCWSGPVVMLKRKMI